MSYGETPIDPDMHEFLMPACSALTTLAEINEVELENTFDAQDWIDAQDWAIADLLNQGTLREVHRRMFCDVWTWAGKLRVREENMGIAAEQIAVQWEQLIGNTLWQVENSSIDLAELGIRFHRGMLSIHCFTNGNGRHARMVANKMGEILGLGDKIYTWGQLSGADPEIKRREYVDALRIADQSGDYGPLLKVALS